MDIFQEGFSLHLSCLCFDHILTGVVQIGIQFRVEDDPLVEVGNIVLMVFCITVTVPFDNLSEEQLYSCLIIIDLAVCTLFIIVLIAAAAITTVATIALLSDPLAFSKLEFFSNIPVLFFISLVTSLLRSQRYSTRRIGSQWRRDGDILRSADLSIRNIPFDIRSRSM